MKFFEWSQAFSLQYTSCSILLGLSLHTIKDGIPYGARKEERTLHPHVGNDSLRNVGQEADSNPSLKAYLLGGNPRLSRNISQARIGRRRITVGCREMRGKLFSILLRMAEQTTSAGLPWETGLGLPVLYR